MAATTMSSISSKREQIIGDFDSIRFEIADSTYWSADHQVVYYSPQDTPESLYDLLHEIGHATLGHSDFSSDIDLLKLERQAWQAASRFGEQYQLPIDEETVETALDSYRDWLHARSRCPQCRQTGVQTDQQLYSCLVCQTNWRVNDARQCGLRRYQTK